MRSVNIVVPRARSVESMDTAVKEDILSYYKTKESVDVSTVLYNEAGSQVAADSFNITGSDFDLLMSNDDTFKSGKPENDFREIDLFPVIDNIRRRLTEIDE